MDTSENWKIQTCCRRITAWMGKRSNIVYTSLTTFLKKGQHFWFKIEPDTNKVVFVDRKNTQRTYTDPRLAFAVEDLPRHVGEVRQRFDSGTTALQVLHGKDLSGKLAIITGANVGIGYETAKSLAMHNCDVIMACRNQKSAEEAIIRITKERPAAGRKCQFMECDLASLHSVRNFVKDVKCQFKLVWQKLPKNVSNM